MYFHEVFKSGGQDHFEYQSYEPAHSLWFVPLYHKQKTD